MQRTRDPRAARAYELSTGPARPRRHRQDSDLRGSGSLRAQSDMLDWRRRGAQSTQPQTTRPGVARPCLHFQWFRSGTATSETLRITADQLIPLPRTNQPDAVARGVQIAPATTAELLNEMIGANGIVPIPFWITRVGRVGFGVDVPVQILYIPKVQLPTPVIRVNQGKIGAVAY